MSIAYLNGEYLPLQECKISVLDRGFIFGDAIYELLPVYAGKPFFLDAHLQRLQRSLAQIEITNPYNESDWEKIINTLIERSGLQELYVYLQVTRGVAPRDHAFPPDTPPTVFGMIGAWPKQDESFYSKGLTAVTVEDTRWDRCDIKVTSLLANCMKKQHAVEREAHEAIFIRDGVVLEGSATNVFIVENGKVLTAPKNNLILPGITRDVVVHLLNENNISLIEQAPTEAQLIQADEIWITSSTKECMPVTTLNNQPVANGQPGEIWKKVYALFQAAKK